MSKFIPQWFHDFFKGYDNKWWDLIRVIVAIAFVSMLMFQTWSLLLGHTFSALEFGTGIAAFLTLIVGDRFTQSKKANIPTGKVTHGE